MQAWNDVIPDGAKILRPISIPGRDGQREGRRLSQREFCTRGGEKEMGALPWKTRLALLHSRAGGRRGFENVWSRGTAVDFRGDVGGQSAERGAKLHNSLLGLTELGGNRVVPLLHGGFDPLGSLKVLLQASLVVRQLTLFLIEQGQLARGILGGPTKRFGAGLGVFQRSFKVLADAVKAERLQIVENGDRLLVADSLGDRISPQHLGLTISQGPPIEAAEDLRRAR